MAKVRSVFYCTECGNETPKWAGKCPACGAWNTIVEQEAAPKTKSGRGSAGRSAFHSIKAISLTEVDTTEEIRFFTGMGELDRVLGGGAVKGSLVLVGGAPGVGKSTLMLQICGSLCKGNRVLYVSGEESVRQLKLRAQRLGVGSGNLLVLSETALEDVLQSVSDEEPDILIVDSIQTLYNGALDSPPGSIGQVKDCTMALMQLAKGRNVTVFVIGHVNKEGSIAGPKVLEHMVDCVLYFEGEQHSTCRILRAAKNRFGATNEIGVFEMLDAGLEEVENPSQMLLSGRPEGAPGTCVTCVMEGVRPVLAEIQALLAPASYGNARRSSNGFDFGRAAMLLAVLEKRGGLKVSACDAYMNIIGGLTLDEPAADLAAVLALASSYLDKPIDADLAAIGEVGLTGELRAVNNLDQRLSEVCRLGFKTCIVPLRRGRSLRPRRDCASLRRQISEKPSGPHWGSRIDILLNRTDKRGSEEEIMRLFLSFSARKAGNCAYIMDFLRMPQDEVVFFKDLNAHGCSNCGYECFKGRCKYRDDDVYGLLDSFSAYEKVILVVPMYCGNPSSLYFCFNERSQDYFMCHGGDYTAFAERLFIIGVYGSRAETPDFIRCLEKWFEGTPFTHHVLGIERRLYRQGMEDRVTDVEAVQRALREFL